MSKHLALILTILAVLPACHHQATTQRPPHTVHGCNPLATGSTDGAACLLPYPSAWFEAANTSADVATTSGLHVAFPPETLPSNMPGTPISPNLFGLQDGFSPATPIIAWFPEGVAASQLTSFDHPDDSLSSDNPIALIDVASRQRVAFFAELDANATAGMRQALLIHPLARLKPQSRYAVAIRTSLNDATGKPLQPQGDFALWAEGTLPNSSPLAEIADRLDEDAGVFASLGIPKSSLALAWDFDTASVTNTTGPLLAMRDQALQAAPKGLGYKIKTTDTSRSAQSNAYSIINGTFQSPSFETGPDPSPLHWGPDGKPVMGDPQDFPFTAVIPVCAASASGPIPIVILGHGLLGTAADELPSRASMLNNLCMVGIGADWIGVAAHDLGALANAVTDANTFPIVTDRLMQAHVNFQILTRLAMNALRTDPAFEIGGFPIMDANQVYYWGASNGGIQGATFLALSSDVNRGVLNVPGAGWSFLIWRSFDFSALGTFFDMAYPDPLDQQVIIALSQSLWDRSDPIEFAPLLSTSKHVLFQESQGDAMVTNLATRLEMRTIGAIALDPLIEPVWGLRDEPGPLDGFVYTQWSVDPSPLPGPANVPPAANSAHGGAQDLPAAIEQAKQFLQQGGKVANTCNDAPCVFPGG